MPLLKLLTHFRGVFYSERNKGERFERLMQAYLKTQKSTALGNSVRLFQLLPNVMTLPEALNSN